jgi:DNA-binding transcriptional LysR family regulator
MANRMDKLRAITCFMRTVEKGSLTAAAADLQMSLPSMTRTLAALERELGTTLLNRTTRHLYLTDDGRQYLEHCRQILDQVRDAEATLRSRRIELRGRLTVTASVLFGRHFIAPLASEFIRRHPGVVVDLVFVDRVVNLLVEGVDAAVRIGRLADSSLVAIQLSKVRRVVCAAPAYLQRRGVPQSVQDIRRHDCVQFNGLAPRGDWYFRVGTRRRHVVVNAVLSCNQADAAIDACASGAGLGSFLSYMVAPYIRDGRLNYVLEALECEPLPIHFVYPYTRMLSPVLRAFSDWCVPKLRVARFD